MENLRIENIIISKQVEETENYQKFKEIAKNKRIKVILAGINNRDVQRLQIEKDIYLDILWPNNEKQIHENMPNNNSIVCKLSYINFSILFTGDIEQIAEKQILKQYKNNLKVLNSNILKVAHHGSRTSSIEEFIKAVKPKMALIGVGKDNKFGHPNEEVIDRLKNIGCIIYRTDEHGEISLTINKKMQLKIYTNYLKTN